MITDIRLALRTLPRMPGFSLAFILTLGLGIGANTAIFSVINGVLLRPLPVSRGRPHHAPAPAAGVGRRREHATSRSPEVADYRSQSKTIDQFVEFGDWTFNVLGRGEPHRATGGLVTANFFQMLGAQPQLGRMLRRRRRRQGGAAGRGAHPRLLAARLRLRPVRRRPDARPDREEGADRRRAGAGRRTTRRSGSRTSTSTTRPTITTWARRCRTSAATA